MDHELKLEQKFVFKWEGRYIEDRHPDVFTGVLYFLTTDPGLS